MPDEVEIETKDLQETIQELQEERKEREQAELRSAWTRYIALTTAVLAVFAAIGALQSGTLVNEAMILQLKASDKWNEYQADRQKEHLYAVHAFTLLDSGATPPARPSAGGRQAPGSETESQPAKAQGSAEPARGPGTPAAGQEKEQKRQWKPSPPRERLRQYIHQAEKETRKEGDLREEAERLERQSEHHMHLHHQFARSVALIQVAIALSAVAALTRMKLVWSLSLLVGIMGLAFFGLGIASVR